MRRALVIAVALVGGLSAAASANPLPPNPVHVYQGPGGSVCVGISLQVAHCTPPVTAP